MNDKRMKNQSQRAISFYKGMPRGNEFRVEHSRSSRISAFPGFSRLSQLSVVSWLGNRVCGQVDRALLDDDGEGTRSTLAEFDRQLRI